MTPLTNDERHVLLESLLGGGEALVEAVAELTPAQWNFRPGPESWTIAECCEHVELTEDRILARLASAGSDGLDQTAGKDQFVPRRSQPEASRDGARGDATQGPVRCAR